MESILYEAPASVGSRNNRTERKKRAFTGRAYGLRAKRKSRKRERGHLVQAHVSGHIIKLHNNF